MNKIGYLIDEKILKLENSKEKREDKIKKNQETLLKFKQIYQKFESLATPPENQEISEISLRVKILVKNMLEDKSKGWEKTKKQHEAGPKKVDDLRKELEKKAMEEQKIRMEEDAEEMYGKQ